jgi:predicted TIM-barrel fold metal-dependent hydrolase
VGARPEVLEVAGFLAELDLPGIVDVHVHFMPDRVQQKVWAHFDRLDPPWPITYRSSEAERLAILRQLRVRRHTALAYAHRPGMAAWLNAHTLALAAREPAVVPSFTLYPEDDAPAYVAEALAGGGACAKVHLQVGRFDPVDRRLDEVWPQLARAGTPVVLHAGAVDDGSGGEEFCGVAPVVRLLDRFPGLVLVVAHAGAPDHADFLALAEATPTVHLDTAMVQTDPPYLTELTGPLLDRLQALGDRVLFGSDFPGIPYTYDAQVRGLVRAGLGRDWLRAVLWTNGVRLFGAPPAT